MNKMKRFWLIILVFLASHVFAIAAAGAGQVVRDIVVTNVGAGQVDAGFVLTRISSIKGSELDKQAVSRDMKALLDTGMFSDVKVRAEAAENGVTLVYSVQSKLRLAEAVAVSGADYYRESKIRGFLGLEVGDLIDDQVMSIRANRVATEYRKEHFPDVSVTWKIDEADHSRGMATAGIVVVEGRRARVGQVIIDGNTQIADKVLVSLLKPPVWWNPFSWFQTTRYNPDELEIARIGIRDMYLNRGFLDVAVETPTVQKAVDQRLIITIKIQEGPLYRIGKVSLSGITVFPETELRRLVRLKMGDAAVSEAIESTAQVLRDFYGSRGYINTVVRPVRNPVRDSIRVMSDGGSEGAVDIQFVFTEGNPVYIRNIDIRGNTRTRDKVIRRELLVYPGEIFDEVKVRTSRNRLMNLGYFSDVRADPVNTRDPDQDDLLIEVEEKQTGQFNVGIGFSSIDRLTGFIGLTQNNFDLAGWPYFTGGGQKLRLSAQAGETTKDYDISFIEPWFLDRKLSLGLNLFMKEWSYSDNYDLERTGGSITLGKSLPWQSRIDFQYQLERVSLSDISDTNEYFHLEPYTANVTSNSYHFTDEDQSTAESSFGITLTRDTRDHPLVPTRGLRASISATISGGPMGFDTDIYELGFNGTQYVPLWYKHVLSIRAKLQVVESYGNTAEVPISDRLFIGGARTLRGFDYRDVGPKVARNYETNGVDTVIDHKPIGGKTLALASAEYTIPVFAVIRVAAFYDIGNVWSDSYQIDLGHLASSAGVGLRFDMPGFPIRIDRAWTIKKDNPLTDEDTWVFWIGYPY